MRRDTNVRPFTVVVATVTIAVPVVSSFERKLMLLPLGARTLFTFILQLFRVLAARVCHQYRMLERRMFNVVQNTFIESISSCFQCLHVPSNCLPHLLPAKMFAYLSPLLEYVPNSSSLELRAIFCEDFVYCVLSAEILRHGVYFWLGIPHGGL